MKTESTQGRVAIVGAGPGDPELLTLRAWRLLRAADVILVDQLVDRRVLACCPEARVIDVGKRARGRATSQDVINALLVKEARNGQAVVRLKGGDPFVFGRGAEEAIYLSDHGIPFEVVPGISSSVGAPLAAGIPVTHRGVSRHFSVITGCGADGIESLRPQWETLARAGGTLVFLMGVKNLGDIVDAVRAGGRSDDTPCAMVERGTSSLQRVIEAPLAEIVRAVRANQVCSPAVLIVGEVVSLRGVIAGLPVEARQEVG